MKEVINLFAVMLSWGLSSLFLAIFLSTTLAPNYAVTILTNQFNEFWLEAVLFSACWLLITTNMAILVWRFRR